MAGGEIGLRNQIAGADRLGAEAQVRGGHRARFLRIVYEVPLGKVIGILADDLDRVLVGADGAVGAQAVKHAAHGLGIFGRELRIVIDRGMRHIVHDADGEVVLALGARQFIQHALHHGGSEFLGGQARNGRRSVSACS